ALRRVCSAVRAGHRAPRRRGGAAPAGAPAGGTHMGRISRRSFLEIAAAIGATAAWGAARAKPSNSTWQERRERFPEGVASGDPDSHSVLLWTRCPQSAARTRLELRVEVAQDPAFQQVVASTLAPVA